ncbi:cryptochrome/photolyase family protein [Aquibium oceanicum]|uniref:Cryptochrome/photolyase family protein n=1 Tax=Aquibium oceanicum TaxID=1670800 RepID=A0A1L3STW8_9HYPH|nr:cryptochrome/photolyase family protein [Aquibium oceanicum]APH72834.1 cryptochrome/photolyase family protein [Aquibium oceanicum]
MIRTLRFLLGDQLSRSMSSMDGLDPGRDVVVMAEVGAEATYVRHHKKKIAFLFSAMRHFAEELRAEGVTVDYVRFGEARGPRTLGEALQRAVERHRPDRVVVTEAGEWRLLQAMRDWAETLPCPVEIREDTRFHCSTGDFAEWAETRKGELRMEFFYREMRRRTGYLMRGDRPEGGAWNLDRENRRPLPADIDVPRRPRFEPDATTRTVIDLVAANFPQHFGDLEPFDHPVTRSDALTLLDWFVEHALPLFGDYQDAMRTGEPLLFHSHLSALINCGLLLPAECCRRAEDAYHSGHAPLNAVEGFIRQIVGWREYVRGIYWWKMPAYATANALGADRPLPWFFWSGETDMNCLAQAIGETKANAYAHHIQRLMVIGNFCLLAGLDPREVQEWYLVVYHDAYEWVEMPNVVGMILFADGGLMASKPYAASGSYIDRMSDYCGACRFDVKKRHGPDACPFNYLYWDFLARHRERLGGNRRMRMMYATLDRMKDDDLADMRRSAAAFLSDPR